MSPMALLSLYDINRSDECLISDGGTQKARERVGVGVTALQHNSFVSPNHQQDSEHYINSIIPVCVILCEQVPHSFMFREKENDMLFLAVAGEMGQAALFSMSTR